MIRRLVIERIEGQRSFAIRVDCDGTSRYASCLGFDEALGVVATFVLDRPMRYLKDYGRELAQALKWADTRPCGIVEALRRLHNLAPEGRARLPEKRSNG